MNNEMMMMPQSGALVGANGAMTTTATGTVAVQQSAAMVMQLARMQMAAMRPRNVLLSRDRILEACRRETLASAATYKYAKGGTNITGPSIRLAEVLAQNWGNIDYGIKEVETRNGASTVLTYALDLETNAQSFKEFQVSHIIDLKDGKKKILTSDRDIYEKVANYGARRLRSCILAVIPGDIVEDALDQCEETLKNSVGDDETFKKKVNGLMKAFKAQGVNKKMVEARIQRHIDSMDRAQYVHLVEIGNSIKDGMSNKEDWFDMSLADTVNADDGNEDKKQPPKKDSVSALNEKLGVSGLKKGSEIAQPAQKKEAQNGNAAAPANAAPANAEAKKDAPPANNAANAKPAAAPATSAPATAQTAQTTQKKEDPNSLF